MTGSPPNALARTLRHFFTDHLPSILGVSRHTIQSYRYALILLLRFLATRHGPSRQPWSHCLQIAHSSQVPVSIRHSLKPFNSRS